MRQKNGVLNGLDKRCYLCALMREYYHGYIDLEVEKEGHSPSSTREHCPARRGIRQWSSLRIYCDGEVFSNVHKFVR